MLHTHLAALALATTTLVASGCGGSSKTGATAASKAPATTATVNAGTTSTTAPASPSPVKIASAKPLSLAQWIAKGDAICARLNAQLAASPVKSLKDFGRVLPQAAAYERAEFVQLIKLAPPPSKVADWQRILANTRQWAENSDKLGLLAQAGRFSPNMPLSKSTAKLHVQLAKIAKHDGFKECSLI